MACRGAVLAQRRQGTSSTRPRTRAMFTWTALADGAPVAVRLAIRSRPRQRPRAGPLSRAAARCDPRCRCRAPQRPKASSARRRPCTRKHRCRHLCRCRRRRVSATYPRRRPGNAGGRRHFSSARGMSFGFADVQSIRVAETSKVGTLADRQIGRINFTSGACGSAQFRARTDSRGFAPPGSAEDSICIVTI